MSEPRSILASAVGWVIVALVAIVLGGWLIGTFFWLIRMLLFLALIVGLVWIYFRLKGDPGG